MTSEDQNDQAPEEGGGEEILDRPKRRPSYEKARRDLSEEDLANPAAQQLILDKLDDLEQEKDVLSNFRDKFHQKDKSVAVLIERLKAVNSNDVLYGVCLTMGALAIGFVPNVWSHKVWPWMFLVFGAVLIVGAIISKQIKK